MNNLKLEPALLFEAAKIGLVMFVTFGWIAFTADQQTWIVAALAAGFGLAKAFTTHPFPVTAVTDFVQAVGVVAIGFNTGITQPQLASLVAFVGAITVLLQRSQITPLTVPAPAAIND